MDRDELKEVAPHYAAMILLVYLALGILWITVGGLGFWGDLVIVVAIVVAYRPVVMRLGIGPSSWEQR